MSLNLREDRPGTLSKTLEAIAEAGVSIEGYAEIEVEFARGAES